MIVVVAIIGLMVGIALPSIAAGIDSVRLATATTSVAGFLNAAVTRAERRQQAMEMVISPKDSTMTLYSSEAGYSRELKLESVRIEAVLPEIPDDAEGVRHVLLVPGSTVPGIGIQLGNRRGAHRIVRLDPMTGFPHVESVDINK